MKKKRRGILGTLALGACLLASCAEADPVASFSEAGSGGEEKRGSAVAPDRKSVV